MERCNKRVWSNGDMEDCGVEAVVVLRASIQRRAERRLCKRHVIEELEKLWEVEESLKRIKEVVADA